MRLLLCLLLLAIGVSPSRAQDAAPISPARQRELVMRLVRDVAAPRYDALRTAALDQDKAWHAFCGSPSVPGVDALRDAFANTVRTWEAVSEVRYGPVSENFRYERVAYWPERKNEVGRALARLLSGDEPLTADFMPAKSVAVQGLTALERVIYDEGARDKLTAGNDEARRRCAAGTAMAGNLASISGELAAGWSDLDAGLAAGDEAMVREAAARFATDFVTVFQVVGDLKIDAVMGGGPDEAKPRAAQYWRSSLSNAAIAENLGAAAETSEQVLGADAKAVAALREAEKLALGLSAPLHDLATTVEGRREVLLLRNAVRRARDAASEAVPVALGVMVGFNSLDGD